MSDEVSLSSISSLIMDLSNRLDRIEKRKANEDVHDDRGIKRPKRLQPNTSSNSSLATASTSTGITSYSDQLRNPVCNSLLTSQSRVRHSISTNLVPVYGEPSATGIEEDLSSNSNHPLVINAVLDHNESNLDSASESNINLEDLENMIINVNEEDLHCEARDSDFNSLTSDGQTTPDLTAQSLNVVNKPLPIIGKNDTQNWNISEETLSWFKTVADLDLKDEEITEIEKPFSPVEELRPHFTPPEIPPVLWSKLKNNNAEYFKQKSLLRAQKLNCSGLKPILSVIDNMDPADPNRSMLASAVQLIACSNLQISRTRRSATAKHVRADLRSNLFSNQVTHQNLFGSSFDTVSEQAVKTSSSIQKLLVHTKKPFFNPKQLSRPPFEQKILPGTSASTSANAHITTTSSTRAPERKQFFRSSFRGRGSSSYKPRGSRK